MTRAPTINTKALEPQQFDNSQVQEGCERREAVVAGCLWPFGSGSQVSAARQVCVTIIEWLRGPLVAGPSLLSRHTDSNVNGGAWPI